MILDTDSPSDGADTLVLASGSPRRRALLRLLDIRIVCLTADVDETLREGESAWAMVRRLAAAKASAADPGPPVRAVLGADTAVVLDGAVLGKPTDDAHAREMLRALRGRAHDVVTGVALARAGQLRWLGAARTVVEMRSYADREIDAYVESGRGMDKAGGYAIQDERFQPVAAIDGCYPNVVGLPLCEVSRGFRALGLASDGPARRLLAPCGQCWRARQVEWT